VRLFYGYYDKGNCLKFDRIEYAHTPEKVIDTTNYKNDLLEKNNK